MMRWHARRQNSSLTHADLNRIALTLAIALAKLGALVHASDSEPIFPGVGRDLQPFCSARPSLPVNLAAMVVHVKRNTSFNYKLYLFSGQDYVFQTGQIVPRDDFRVHSFPVKMKKLSEFWPSSLTVYRVNEFGVRQVASEFELRRFLAPVQLSEREQEQQNSNKWGATDLSNERERRSVPAFDLQESALLPGDSAPDATLAADPNAHIEFDRDDQVALLDARLTRPAAAKAPQHSSTVARAERAPKQTLVPVGAFSSFHVNVTYLVRKDFGQHSAQLIRLVIDANKFQVVEAQLLNDNNKLNKLQIAQEEFSFLSHKLLRDPNTRITSINQIYEGWIANNFYTIVYVQRKSEQNDSGKLTAHLFTDRLIFRGSSSALIGADQLDYAVGASVFITEKNGLHYYLEFLAAKQKFHIGAIDWSKRPFTIIDAQRAPIKQTQTMHDNEELLLCPPAVCYAERPIDELVAYGRLELDDIKPQPFRPIDGAPVEREPLALLLLASEHQAQRPKHSSTEAIGLGSLTGTKVLASAHSLELKLHLRDWTWSLERGSAQKKFAWSFNKARRNELKANQDSYGFALSGHEIDASFRVLNELYLISSNQIISINYTLANETVISSHPIGEEFHGLSSTLADPITGAFYDRLTNHVFFFKGDRYVGYDYASKRPLDDFQLPAPRANGAAALTLSQPIDSHAKLLITTLPVVGILGRQHYVDAVYHDLVDDEVYVFTGMKFYSYRANEFKDGSFRASRKAELPRLRCINQHFLIGCQFDAAYPNPCQDEPLAGGVSSNKSARLLDLGGQMATDRRRVKSEHNFIENQQTKLRSVATGRRGGLVDFLVENRLISNGVGPVLSAFPDTNKSTLLATMFAASKQMTWAQENVVVCLLVAIVSITIIVTVAMVIVILQWTSNHSLEKIGADHKNSSKTAPASLKEANSRATQYAANVTRFPSRIRSGLFEQQQHQPLHYASSWLRDSDQRRRHQRLPPSQFSPTHVQSLRNENLRQQPQAIPKASHNEGSPGVDSSAL